MTNTKQATRTIGQDNGIGDIFSAEVKYEDGSSGFIIVYGGNLQGANSYLNLYAPIWKFVVLHLS